jgi:hypothetical protein
MEGRVTGRVKGQTVGATSRDNKTRQRRRLPWGARRKKDGAFKSLAKLLVHENSPIMQKSGSLSFFIHRH